MPRRKLKKREVTLKKILLLVMLVVFVALTAIAGTNKENIEKWFAEKIKEAVATENVDVTNIVRNPSSNNSYQQRGYSRRTTEYKE